MKNINRFTPREMQVAQLLVLGMTNAEIAAAIICQRCTVKAFVEKLLEKTGAKNRTHLVYLLGCQNYEETCLEVKKLV